MNPTSGACTIVDIVNIVVKILYSAHTCTSMATSTPPARANALGTFSTPAPTAAFTIKKMVPIVELPPCLVRIIDKNKLCSSYHTMLHVVFPWISAVTLFFLPQDASIVFLNHFQIIERKNLKNRRIGNSSFCNYCKTKFIFKLGMTMKTCVCQDGPPSSPSPPH